MNFKQKGKQLNFLSKFRWSLWAKPKKTGTEQVADKVKNQTAHIQWVLALKNDGSSIYWDNVVTVNFKNRANENNFKVLDKWIEFSIEMSNLVIECERLFFTWDIEWAFELVVRIESIASEKYNLDGEDLKKYWIYDLLISINFTFFKKYWIFDPLDEENTLERIQWLSDLMWRKFNNDDRTYYYFLNLINSYILWESNEVLRLLKGTWMWVIDRGVGIYDFLMYSLEYIKHELTQEKSLNKRIYILKRIQFLAEVIEKLSNTYLEEQNENLSKIIEELIISNLEEQNENLSKAIDDLNKIFYIKWLLEEIKNPNLIKELNISVNN